MKWRGSFSSNITISTDINSVFSFQFDCVVGSKFSGKTIPSQPGQAIGILLGG